MNKPCEDLSDCGDRRMEFIKAYLCKICFVRKLDLIDGVRRGGFKKQMQSTSCRNVDYNFRHTGSCLDCHVAEVKHVYLQIVVLLLTAAFNTIRHNTWKRLCSTSVLVESCKLYAICLIIEIIGLNVIK